MARSGWKEIGMKIFPRRVRLFETSHARRWHAATWHAMRWLAAALCAGVLVAQQPTTFRTDVNLVRIVATVKTQAGQIVGTLAKDEFEVYDNGAKQQVGVFEHQTEQALSVVLMVDTSGSTAKELRYEADSASRFFHALLDEGSLDDTAALYTFNWEVREQQPFTRGVKALDARLKLLHGEAGTAMYDAVYLGAQRLEPRQGRKVIVVVTDGGDTVSKVNVHKALEAAQLADAIIYAIVVMPITNDAGRNIGGEHALDFMANGTGGRCFLPTVGAELDKAFNAIVTELRTQYLLGYYPRNVPLNKDRFHKLEVRVTRPDLRVSARTGYYGEVEGGRAASPEDRVTVSPERQPKPTKKR
jgi:Ca-activated chloride channel family protein